jgi:hypothetical protein
MYIDTPGLSRRIAQGALVSRIISCEAWLALPLPLAPADGVVSRQSDGSHNGPMKKVMLGC